MPALSLNLLLILSAAAAVMAGCGGSSSGERDELIGDWMFLNTDTSSGIGLSFRADDTYVFTAMAITGSVTANAEFETGRYSVSGDQVTFTPQESSCAGPDPAYEGTCKVSGATLVLSAGTTLITMNRSTSSGGSIALTIGCFDQSGAFTPRAVSPVSP